ncbi:Uncharacterised protein [Sphingobacterium daejeonense]|nr:Uncharacterised protein [Sphingobacterium daejeonense]
MEAIIRRIILGKGYRAKDGISYWGNKKGGMKIPPFLL